MENPAEYDYAKNSCARTARWLLRCKAEMARLKHEGKAVNPDQLLFGINQGCTYKDLRVEHMKQIAEYDLDGYAIGGLAVGEPAEVMYDVISAVWICLTASCPAATPAMATCSHGTASSTLKT